MSGGALEFEGLGKGTEADEKDIGGGKGSDEGMWWHVGALGAAVRSARSRLHSQQGWLRERT